MKRWAILLSLLITVILTMTSSVFAADYDGRIEVYCIDENYSPVQGVKIQLLYGEDLVDIHELGLETTITLESNSDGMIILDGVPYGYYKYNVEYVPDGYETLVDSFEFVVSVARNISETEIYLKEVVTTIEAKNDLILDEVPIEIKPIRIENKQETIIPVVEEEKQIEEIPVVIEDNSHAIETSVNTLTTNIYNIDENTGVIEKTQVLSVAPQITQVEKVSAEKEEIIVQNTISRTREKYKVPGLDIIQKFKEYRLIDCIKIAINQVNTHVDNYMKIIADLPDDDRKDKKMKGLDVKVEKIKYDKTINMYTSQRAQSLFR